MTAQGIFDEPEGATPLDPDDATGLKPTWIATRGDLNQAEGDNISRARVWAFVQHGPWKPEQLLGEPVVRGIHRRMFSEVWSWAGEYRMRTTNIGVAPHEIREVVKALVDDVGYQVSIIDDLPWGPDELAVRFHYRLVAVHPFPNGNGRHARLCADILVSALGKPAFTWGGADLSRPGTRRDEYLSALRVADAEQDFAGLIRFARA